MKISRKTPCIFWLKICELFLSLYSFKSTLDLNIISALLRGHLGGPVVLQSHLNDSSNKRLLFWPCQTTIRATPHKVQCLLKREINDLLFQTPPPPKKETRETLNSIFHYNYNPSQSRVKVDVRAKIDAFACFIYWLKSKMWFWYTAE